METRAKIYSVKKSKERVSWNIYMYVYRENVANSEMLLFWVPRVQNMFLFAIKKQPGYKIKRKNRKGSGKWSYVTICGWKHVWHYPINDRMKFYPIKCIYAYWHEMALSKNILAHKIITKKTYFLFLKKQQRVLLTVNSWYILFCPTR